ncbi:MAG TPA: ATPase, T2SS/T4P/T4SS family [Candidatus Sulfotelmatobacter sp.]|nr:ATPase, T2SS/T4P/T4SS family [Candidatus Sulfotelmatobacter sp.]
MQLAIPFTSRLSSPLPWESPLWGESTLSEKVIHHPLAKIYDIRRNNTQWRANLYPQYYMAPLSIRKPALDRLTSEEYLRRGTATIEMLSFLHAVVRGRGNVLIAGPTGTGKTTLLRYLGGYFDPAARVVVMEQVAELGLERFHPHVVPLEARGGGALSMAELLQHALHRRPDYIVMRCP